LLHHKKPANVSPPVWDISQEVCFPSVLNRSCSVEVLPCVHEHDLEDLSNSVKENNTEHVLPITSQCHDNNGARLISHKSLDNDNSPQTTHGE